MTNTFFHKTIFIVGGSGLIGSAVIKQLALQDCKIINLDIVKKKENLSLFYKFDLSKNNIEKNYFKIVKKYGLPDIFINCSYPKTKDWNKSNFGNIKINSLKKNVESQIINSSYLAKNVAELNKKKKRKCSIVLLGSIYGLVGQDNSIYSGTKTKENLAYALAKGALVNLTRQMSSYYSRYGIRVNNVCPGGVYDKSISKSDKNYKKLIKNYSKRSPIGRMASPEEIADPIIFLASEQSSYITGTSLVVDGGWTSI
jgi:NAD(P)-dependent dehydrogenase (short-subunit alcohol dehydrogenase family)